MCKTGDNQAAQAADYHHDHGTDGGANHEQGFADFHERYWRPQNLQGMRQRERNTS